MNFLKSLFEGKQHPLMHDKFTRYGNGEYERLYFEIKKGKDLKIKSSFDFANDFVGIIADRIKENATVSGKLIAARDFEKELGFPTTTYTKRGKLYTAELNTTLKPDQLKSLYDKMKEDFLLLKIESDNFKLKTKNSLPKPGGRVKPNFCSATLPLECLDEFAWDVKKDFKLLIIKHVLHITDVEFSQELMKKDPARARLEARRKGKIERLLNIDGSEEKREAKLDA